MNEDGPAVLASGTASERDSRLMAQRRFFVGRDREVDDIAGAFGDAAVGRGALFLLVGSAGIGKTRLADELGRRAEEHGLRVAWGRCWETGGAPAYWPWIQILRELLGGLPAEQRMRLAGDGPGGGTRAAAGPGSLVASAASDELRELLPALDSLPVANVDPTQARFRLFDEVTASLRSAALDRPLFLVLDDLHTADPSSLALLHFLARNLRGLRALVVGTYREEEARVSAEVGALLGDVAREATYLPLAPLSANEMGALVARFTGSPPPPTLLDALGRATEGNPLFLDELLRLLSQRGELAAAAAATTLPVPHTVREVIRRRIARLPEEARALLGLASVAGREVELAVLASLAGRPMADVAAHLEPAETAGLLNLAAPGRYRFSHVLVRETLYKDLPLAERAAAHLQLATGLESHGDGALAEVAHHRLVALPAGDAGAAAAAMGRAAARAMDMLAFEDAAALLERGRVALEAAGALTREEQFELRLQAGLALMSAGRAAEGRAMCVRAASEARALGDGARLAQAALGYGAELMLAQSDRTLIGLLEEALAALPPGASGLRAQVMVRLAAARIPSQDVLGPMAMAREAIAMARSCGAGPATVRKVLFFAGSALADYGPPEERAAISEEMITLAREAGDRSQVLRGEGRLVFDYLENAEVARSQEAIERYAELARAFNQPRHLWPACLMRAMYALAYGRLEEASTLLEEGRALATQDRDPVTASVFAWHELWRVIELEQTDLADRALAELTAAVRIPAFERISEGMIDVARLMLLGRFSDDRAHLQATLDAQAWTLPHLSHDVSIMIATVEAVAVCGDRRRARMLYDALRTQQHRIGTWGRSGFVCTGFYAMYVGLLAGTLEQWEEADRLLQQAAQHAVALGFQHFVGLTHYWRGRFLWESGKPEAGALARAAWDQADAHAARLELPRLAARVAAARAKAAPDAAVSSAEETSSTGDLPGAPPVVALAGVPMPGAGRAFSLTQEGEFWTVRAGEEVARVRDSRGMQMLHELVAHPGREMHVLALMGSAAAEVDGGDAGELLDEEAMSAYRARLQNLDEELSLAEGWADAGRASRARAEREALAHELTRGMGLGGRSRRAGGAGERARVNVQRRIRGSIRKIAETLPELGAYLDRAVRTGSFCVFEPF